MWKASRDWRAGTLNPSQRKGFWLVRNARFASVRALQRWKVKERGCGPATGDVRRSSLRVRPFSRKAQGVCSQRWSAYRLGFALPRGGLPKLASLKSSPPLADVCSANCRHDEGSCSRTVMRGHAKANPLGDGCGFRRSTTGEKAVVGQSGNCPR